MATSGIVALEPTAGDIIKYAWRKSGRLPTGQEPSAEQYATGQEALNLMLKTWQKHTVLWRRSRQTITLTSDTASYTPSPIPRRIISCRFRQDSRDLPMWPMTADEYDDLPIKTSNGTPTQFYYDRQRATGTLYVWPVLKTASGETLEVTYQRRHEMITERTQEIDIAEDWLEMTGDNLAARIAAHRVEGWEKIEAMAREALESALDSERPDEIQFMPGEWA